MSESFFREIPGQAPLRLEGVNQISVAIEQLTLHSAVRVSSGGENCLLKPSITTNKLCDLWPITNFFALISSLLKRKIFSYPSHRFLRELDGYQVLRTAASTQPV